MKREDEQLKTTRIEFLTVLDEMIFSGADRRLTDARTHDNRDDAKRDLSTIE